MITIKVYEDGSALKTYESRDGVCVRNTALSADDVVKELGSLCANSAEPLGCGMCLTCKVKAAWDERLKGHPRRVSNAELADLSSNWENPTVDTTKFYMSAIAAWEVDQETYYKHVNEDGGLGQIQNGRYYIA